MTNYGQQPPNPYQQNPYGQQPGPYQQGQQPQGPYGQPVQYGQRPQYGQQPQPQYGQQPPPNPYQQPNPYAGRDARQPQPQPPAPPGQQAGQQQGPWVAQTPSRPTVVPRAIPVVTVESLPGREITEIIGDVVGVVARSRDLPPELRAGGMEAGYVSMLTRSRQEAIARAVEMAESAGADAIVGLRFDCSEITQNLSEVVAYGTAVKLAPRPGSDSEPTGTTSTPASEASAEPPASTTSASESEPTISTPRTEWPPPDRTDQS